MMSTGIGVGLQGQRTDSDPVQQLRDARDAPSVHKIGLASLRAYKADCIVFVCEGVDDKKVYFHWLKSLQFSLDYEFLVCNGKEKVFKFRELLSRDVSGLGEGVYFIVDKDFDGLRGYPDGSDIYLTDTYSFENHLVNSDVLERILSVEMHCHCIPAIRSEVIEKFQEVYEAFLEVTRPHNFRIYLARRLGIATQPLPTKVNKLARMTLLEVSDCADEACKVIVLSREPEVFEIEKYKDDFNKLIPQKEFRGKFSLIFFLRWIDLLGKDRNSEDSVLFGAAPKPTARASTQISLDSIASKSSPPEDFGMFVKSIMNRRLHPSFPTEVPMN